MSFGIRLNVFILKILGVIPFGNQNEKNTWRKSISSLYTSIVCVLLYSCQIIMVSSLVFGLLGFKPDGRKNSLHTFLVYFPYFLWLIVTISLMHYFTKFPLKNIITRLYKIFEKFSEPKHNLEGKGIALGCVLAYVLIIFQSYVYPVMQKDLHTILSITDLLTSFYELIETNVCVLFCLTVHRISLYLKNLLKYQYINDKQRFKRKKRPSIYLVKYTNKNSKIIKQMIKQNKNIKYLQDFTSRFFDYMRFPISLIYISDLVYLIADVVKLAMFEKSALYNVVDCVQATLKLGLISHCADMLARQVWNNFFSLIFLTIY